MLYEYIIVAFPLMRGDFEMDSCQMIQAYIWCRAVRNTFGHKCTSDDLVRKVDQVKLS